MASSVRYEFFWIPVNVSAGERTDRSVARSFVCLLSIAS